MTDHKQTLGDLADQAAGGDDGRGIRCKLCGCRHSDVIESIKAGSQYSRRRVRICRHCGGQTVTRERAVD